MNSIRKDEEKILSPEFLDEIRRIREERNISIEEVAEKTNIKAAYIRAIENGDLSRLPGGVYNKAFIRSISEFLGIDMKPYERKAESDEMIKERRVRVELGRPQNASMPSKFIIIASLLGVFVVYSVYFGPRVSKQQRVERAIDNHNKKVTSDAQQAIKAATTPEQKQVAESEMQAQLSDTTALIKRIPQISPLKRETQHMVDKELVITLLASRPVKVLVKDFYGKNLLEKQMEATEATMLNGSGEYFLMASDISALEVYLDGVQIRDMNKLEKRGTAYVLRAPEIVSVAEGQTYQKAVVAEQKQPAQAEQKQEAKPAAEKKNADKPKNNTQGTDR